MTPPNAYPCALCDQSFHDEAAFRRHLEDAHGFFDSQGTQAPVPAAPPRPAPPPPPRPSPVTVTPPPPTPPAPTLPAPAPPAATQSSSAIPPPPPPPPPKDDVWAKQAALASNAPRGRGVPSWNAMSTVTRVGVVAVGLAVILLVLAVAGVFSSPDQKLTAAAGPPTTREPAVDVTSTTEPGAITTLVSPAQLGVPTTLPAVVSGSTSGGSAVASTGGRSTAGSNSSSGSTKSGSTSGGETPGTAPRPAPATTAPGSSGGCPTARPTVSISSFQRGAPDAVDFYPVDVSGVVHNNTSATIDLYSVTLSFYDAQGALVDTDSAQLSGSLGPGQSRTWSTHSDVDGTNGEPTHATGRLRYDWTDTSLDRCPT